MYFAILYQTYLSEHDMNLISCSRVMIPTPKFYVFYHGGPKQEERWKMKLSDSFLSKDDSGDFQWTATIINLHPNHNGALNKSCIPLYHYVKFVSMITTNIEAGLEKKQAIEKAVDEAIKENLLEGFFKIHRAEVIGMCLTEIDEEEARRIWHKDGFAEGRTDGRQQKAVEDALMLVNEYKEKPEVAAQKVNAPLELVLAALKK